MPDSPPPRLTRVPPRPVALAVLAARRTLLRAADALVPPQLPVFEDAVGIGVTMTLAAAVRLRLADRLAGGPQTVADLAAAAEADADALGRLLRALASGGYFRRLPDGRYANNRRSSVLRHDLPGSLAHFVASLGLPSTVAAWSDFERTVRTGRNAFERQHGMTPWDWFAQHPDEGAIFAGAMVDLTRLDAPAVAVAYPWSAFRNVCDVAGGRGTLLAEILRRNPGLRGMLVDAPEVTTAARSDLAGRGLADRVDVVAGNFFEHVPAGSDAYILKDILHDWDDARALAILGRCREAMTPATRLLVVEVVVEPESTSPPGPWIDLHMMTVCAEGRQRSRADFARLAAAAGFRLLRVLPTATPVSVVELLAS